MNRQDKGHVVSSLKNDFTTSQGSFVVSYQGLSVANMQELRRKLRAEQGELKVAKARLMKRAVEGVEGAQELKPYLKDQVALIFVSKETIPVAKILVEFAKEHALLKIIVGCSASEGLIDNKRIAVLATIPPREILLAQLCGILKAPIASLARTISLIKEQAENKS